MKYPLSVLCAVVGLTAATAHTNLCVEPYSSITTVMTAQLKRACLLNRASNLHFTVPETIGKNSWIAQHQPEVVSWDAVETWQLTFCEPQAHKDAGNNPGKPQRTFSDVSCGRLTQVRRSGRIIGGVDARPSEFPWLVSIKRYGGHFCGGTVINKKLILTAAHCLCSGSMILKAQQLKVTVGEHVLSGIEVPEEQELSVTKLILHPRYTCSKYVHDIALLELSSPVTWSDSAVPACLPSESEAPSFTNKEAIVAGWGWTDENPAGLRADVLQKVKVFIVGNNQCNAWYKSQGKKVKVLNTQMCAGIESGGKDSCWADSGGPLMVKNGGSLMVVGIVSTGIGCGRARLPGLYTRISDYISWIRHTIS